MATLIFSFVIVLASIAGLGLGVLLRREPLRGSCGGIACIEGSSCAACQTHRHAEGTQ